MIKTKYFVLVLTSVGFVYALIETSLINSKDVTSFQSYSKVFIAFLIVFMSLYYILQQIKREQKIVHRNLVFAIITYFSLELIFLLPLNFLINYKSELVFYIWLLRLSSNLLFYSYLIRFIWKNGKMQKQLSAG